MGEKIQKFEDLVVWKDSMELTVEIYRLLKDCRDYGLRDQVQRAAGSGQPYPFPVILPKDLKVRAIKSLFSISS
jgi:hypothetical protein